MGQWQTEVLMGVAQMVCDADMWSFEEFMGPPETERARAYNLLPAERVRLARRLTA